MEGTAAGAWAAILAADGGRRCPEAPGHPGPGATFRGSRRLTGVMEERADSTTVWAMAFLVIALAMTVAGVTAIWLGVAVS